MKQEAIRLRISERLSNREIARRLDLPYPTIADWVRPFPLTHTERIRKISQYSKKPNPEFNEKTKLSIQDERLKCFALGLYAGEGSKMGSGVDLCNSNPLVIAVFLRFLREVFNVNEKRLRASLQIKDCQNERLLLAWWARLTKIPKLQFGKTIVSKANPKKNHKRYQGTCRVRYSDQTLLKRILEMIAEMGTLPSGIGARP